MSNYTTIEEGNVPYLQINTDKKKTSNHYFENLSRNLTLENTIANSVKNTWIQSILGHSGEQRNKMAWDYWNKIPLNVLDNSLKYSLYISTKNKVVILNTDFSTSDLNSNINTGVTDNATEKGISLDISNKYLFSVEAGGQNNLIKNTQFDDKKYTYSDFSSNYPLHSITYGSDGFVYISGDGIIKVDPISIYKVQENTDLYLDPSPGYTSYESSGQTIDLNTNGKSDFDKLFDSTYSNKQTGTYIFPSISFNDSNANSSPFCTTFIKDKLNIIFTDNVGLDMVFKLNARETTDFEFAVASNDAHELFIGNETNVKNENESNVEVFKSYYQATEWDTNISYVAGSESITIEADIPKWLKLKWGDEGTQADRGLQFVYRQKGESSWRNVPIITSNFRYTNYDATGPWLWAQNNNGLCKWDPKTMIIKEAQPINNINTDNPEGDIIVNENNIFARTNDSQVSSSGLTKFDKTLNRITHTDLATFNHNSLYFDWNGDIYVCTGDSLDKYNTSLDFITDISLSSNNLQAITITPDKYIFVGFGDTDGTINKIDPSNFNVVNSTTLGSPITGMVYGIEKLA